MHNFRILLQNVAIIAVLAGCITNLSTLKLVLYLTVATRSSLTRMATVSEMTNN